MIHRVMGYLIAGAIFISGPAACTKKTTNINTIMTQSNMDNGLEVVIHESHKVPLVTMVLAVKAGGRTETPETNGVTHLWEHMFFKGNKTLPDQEAFNARIRELGIVYNGDTSAEKVRYYFTLPSAYLEEGLKFMIDAISTPLLEETELAKEINVVLNEYDRNASQPSFELIRVKDQLIYKDKAYLRDALGNRDVIAAANRKMLLKMKNDVFVPSNSALLISGDVDPEKTRELVMKYFSSWENPKNWKAPQDNKFPDFPKTSKLIATHPQAGTPSLSWTFHGPSTTKNPNATYAADILVQLLRMKTGTFYKKFVDSGLTYAASFGYYTQAQAGEIDISASMPAKNIETIEKMFAEEIKLWATDENYFSNEQLEDAKRALVISHKYEINEPSEYIKNLAFWWAVTGLDYYNGYIQNLHNVTGEDIRQFVKTYLLQKPYVSSILITPNDAKTVGLKDNLETIKKKLQQEKF